MLQETIRNDDFQRNTALQHCCDIVSNGFNIVPTLQRCVALKIVVANRLRVTLPLITFPETRFYEPARLSSPHPNPSFHKNRWTPAWLRLLLSRSSIFCLSFIYPVSKMTTTLKKKNCYRCSTFARWTDTWVIM